MGTTTMKEEDLHRKFEHIYKVIKHPTFLSMDALGGEIPFWISTYNPGQETEVNTEIENLITKLQNSKIHPHQVNLFKLCIYIIEINIHLEKMYDVKVLNINKQFK